MPTPWLRWCRSDLAARHTGHRASATGPAHWAQIRCSQLMKPLQGRCCPPTSTMLDVPAQFPPRLSRDQTGAHARAPVPDSIERSDGPVIHFESVTKTYPNQSRPALESVDLDVEKGEFVFLVGPSGSGKSTFLRLILREERPTDGRIYVAGRDLARLTTWKVPQLRRRIGCVFQDFRLLPGKNVYQNIAFALEVIGKPRRFIRKVVPEVIDLVGLEGKGDRMPDELSGGEQQRVAMARAFVNRPMILLADEPTGNIDPATSIGIMKVLDRINRTGTTVVMATHDAAIVDSMRKRVIELEYGKVVRDQSRGVYGQAY